MINLLVIGAKLQGVEAVYLAKKAGYHVVVLDHNADAPGADMADEFFKADVFDEELMLSLFLKVDAVLPAIEDYEVLAKLDEYARKTGTKLIFDINAYNISSSKYRSNELFIKNQLPIPAIYPDCDFPVILKPDSESGSRNVKKAYSSFEVDQYMENHKSKHPVIQEYLSGASYSLEVVGDGEKFYFPQITQVIVDEEYDCKRIIAPADIGTFEKQQMLEFGQKLAESLKIKGIFDIEVISKAGNLKLLEIDARMPSQTPIAVYHSTGMNMVQMMTDLTLGNNVSIMILPAKMVCMYQQIQVGGGKIKVAGEHIMGSCRHLKLRKGFFGCTEAITDYEEGRINFKAIVIVTGETQAQTYETFLGFIGQMKKELGIENWEFIE